MTLELLLGLFDSIGLALLNPALQNRHDDIAETMRRISQAAKQGLSIRDALEDLKAIVDKAAAAEDQDQATLDALHGLKARLEAARAVLHAEDPPAPARA